MQNSNRIRRFARGFAIFALFLGSGSAQPTGGSPLSLTDTWTLPGAIEGHFDHFAVDLEGQRLFVTPEDYKAVLVLELNTGRLLHTIEGIGRPHAVLFRGDIHRLYVTDGEAGELRVFDSDTYQALRSVKLLEDADAIGFDPATKDLYIVNGGIDTHTAAHLTVVDTTSYAKLADILLGEDTLEAMAIELSGKILYVNSRNKIQIDLIDRERRNLMTTWKIHDADHCLAMALDEANHRLFTGCRSGHIVLFDTAKGNQIDSLPISKGVDDLVYDKSSQRIYAACDGFVDVYQQIDPDHYKLLGKVPSGPTAKTAILVPSLGKYFVAVPKHGANSAEILVYTVQ